MRSRGGKTYRRKPEGESFRVTLARLRAELGWNQEALAAKLGVTARTLSNWENGYWLPPVKQRLHVLLALRDVPPQYVLAFAEQLGLATDPAHDAFLQPFRDALEPEPVEGGAESVALKGAVDAVVKEVAGALGARLEDVRAGIARVLAAGVKMGATIEEVHEAVVR
jgi:transcriptional regulator with XRE-family HTH domain